MGKTILILITLAIVAAVGFFTLRGGYQTPQTQPQVQPQKQPQTQTQPQISTPTPSAQQKVKEITVSGTEFSFSPPSLTLNGGETVRLTFQNSGTIPHNWTLEGTDIRTTTITPGSTTIEFTAPQAGTYTFFCSVPGHRASGMVGSLTVE